MEPVKPLETPWLLDECVREKDVVCLLSVSIRADSSQASDGSFVFATLISVSKQRQQVGSTALTNHMTTESLHLDVTMTPGALPLSLTLSFSSLDFYSPFFLSFFGTFMSRSHCYKTTMYVNK